MYFLINQAYSLSSGIALSTFLAYILNFDPSGNLVFLALSSAALIFLGFSFSAVTAQRRSMLYIGAFASSVLSVLLWISLANAFFIRSTSIYSLELYAGLLAFAGFGKCKERIINIEFTLILKYNSHV